MAKHKYISQDAAIDAVDVCNLHRGIIDALQAIISDIPAADVVPWEWLERYADYFCAGVSMPEFVREAKMFYEGTNEAMKGGVIDG